MSELLTDYAAVMAENWIVWVVTLFVIVAAVIDGFELRVPNRLTYPFIVVGWIVSFFVMGFSGGSWTRSPPIPGLVCFLPVRVAAF